MSRSLLEGSALRRVRVQAVQEPGQEFGVLTGRAQHDTADAAEAGEAGGAGALHLRHRMVQLQHAAAVQADSAPRD